MKSVSKRLIAAALTGALILPTVATAEAGSKHGWKHHGGGHHHHHGKKHRRHNNNAGAAVAAGVIGLAAGALLLGATRQPSYAGPPPANYYPPAPYPGQVYGNVGYQPWSPAWYQYCSSKYRSFNPSTGTYTTYQGEQRFCQ